MKKIATILAVLALGGLTLNAADGAGKGKGGKGGQGAKMNPEEAFKMLDKNSDGKVSKEEYMASPQAKKDSAKAEESFKKRDKNSDGSLDMAEFAPAKKKAA